jgi:hypothetical protein
MTDNKNSPAFPTITWDQMADGQFVQVTESAGLTKREKIAAMAMSGLLAGRWATQERVDCKPETIAAMALDHADALLLELSKNQP